ncbi:unnamed protein product [Strongylus vulgaris]|uniref:SXP/RAL-2 family protein Ani s 5-like cation-binding domain-containing protein n=1 Tax=Strongylus vulgaris TaxID=40348 RepID=A0A3P7IYA8_STRVU|nr:unnamed protein product [Strongylus vulgaris]
MRSPSADQSWQCGLVNVTRFCSLIVSKEICFRIPRENRAKDTLRFVGDQLKRITCLQVLMKKEVDTALENWARNYGLEQECMRYFAESEKESAEFKRTVTELFSKLTKFFTDYLRITDDKKQSIMLAINKTIALMATLDDKQKAIVDFIIRIYMPSLVNIGSYNHEGISRSVGAFSENIGIYPGYNGGYLGNNRDFLENYGGYSGMNGKTTGSSGGYPRIFGGPSNGGLSINYGPIRIGNGGFQGTNSVIPENNGIFQGNNGALPNSNGGFPNRINSVIPGNNGISQGNNGAFPNNNASLKVMEISAGYSGFNDDYLMSQGSQGQIRAILGLDNGFSGRSEDSRRPYDFNAMQANRIRF